MNQTPADKEVYPMSIIRLPQAGKPSRNGKAKSAPKAEWSLGNRVDALAELRGLLRKATAEEKVLTQEVLAGMRRVGADRFEGTKAVATIGERTTLTPDVGLFVGALGERAYTALAVRVEAARAVMAADDLAAISETSTTPTLRVQPIGEEMGR